MGIIMRENIGKIKRMEEELYIMHLEIYMKESFKMIKELVKVNLHSVMVAN